MNEYENQALDFLKQTNSTLEIKFLKFDYHFPNDKEKRNIYMVKLSKGSRVFSFPYGDSIANTEKMLDKYFLTLANDYNRKTSTDFLDDIANGCFGSNLEWRIQRKFDAYNKDIDSMRIFSKAGKNKPSTYSILSCLNSQEFKNIDDFIDCFGYSPEDQKVSELLKTFEAVQNESKQLKYLYSDTELELLNDIN